MLVSAAAKRLGGHILTQIKLSMPQRVKREMIAGNKILPGHLERQEGRPPVRTLCVEVAWWACTPTLARPFPGPRQ